ncbi:F0F1 ATP synthase subunit B [Desulfuribacillus alkaliarsenatis]|uniref:ATP synthase subunit b n=1 Tax=Desulfuribacillus alkaliarsenatis TaxID=766136 RepID=A0A1E5G1I9_9FIRM|nr:F0F1 ATP synthase subunit B [Desulfuribacillus alkaliarsenatis]OEF96777.1 ATP synthase F0 subunit B [Desulfuribacillus alkaliarsenatis]
MEFQVGTMIAQLFAFLVLFLLLRKFAFAPLAKAIQDRQDHIEKQIKDAEDQRIQAEKLQAEHRQEMVKAREEALEIVERGRKQSEKQASDILAAAKAETDRMKETAKLEITKEKEQALAELRDQIGSMSVLIASKIIEKDMDEAEHNALIDKYLKEVGKGV